MSNNVLQTEEKILRKYQLSQSELYEYPAEKTVKVLSTCPLNSQIRVIDAPKSSGGDFVFDMNLGEKQFVSNVFQIFYRIPFIVKLKTWPTSPAPDDTNFVKTIFNDNNDIVLAQQGISQAEQSTELRLNDTTIGIVNDIPILTNITTPYYQTDDVDEYLQASQPDRFQSFEQYNGEDNMTLAFLNNECKTTYTTISPMNEQNIFASKYQSGYSTRTPQWELGSINTADKTIKVYCTFWSYLRFSIGATPNDEATLAGINRIQLTTRLMSNLAARVFNIKKTSSVFRYASIEQDLTDVENTKASLMVKIITPPQYMLESMTDKATGKMKPYSIGYPLIVPKVFGSETVAAGKTKSFRQEGIRLDSVPRSIYVAMIKERQGTFEEMASTPINYGLISNLSINLDDSITNFSDQKSLDYVTKSNGYDEMDPLGKLIKGYPIKLNLSKDLALPRDLVVGAAASLNLSVSGNFYNQGGTDAVYKLVVVTVSEATLDYADGSFTRSSGVYVPESVMSNQYFLRSLYYKDQKQLQVLGAGKFGDALKWVGRNAVKLAKNAWANRDAIASTVGDVVNLAKTIRGGEHGGRTAQSNVSGSGSTMLGAGSVRGNVFK